MYFAKPKGPAMYSWAFLFEFMQNLTSSPLSRHCRMAATKSTQKLLLFHQQSLGALNSHGDRHSTTPVVNDCTRILARARLLLFRSVG